MNVFVVFYVYCAEHNLTTLEGLFIFFDMHLHTQ